MERFTSVERSEILMKVMNMLIKDTKKYKLQSHKTEKNSLEIFSKTEIVWDHVWHLCVCSNTAYGISTCFFGLILFFLGRWMGMNFGDEF